MKALIPKIDKFGLVYLAFTLLATEAWLVSPLLQTDGQLPFPGSWYPFDTVAKWYFVPWTIQAYICNIGAANTTNIYLFYVKVIAMICEHFDFLSHSVSRLDVDGCGEGEALSRLERCVRYHCMIKR